MTVKLRNAHVPPELEALVDAGGPPQDDVCEPSGDRNPLVSAGIDRGRFPIGGMRVHDARVVLRRLINVDDEAVAVINGRVVDEDEVIGEDVTHVAFVKPSAVKGGV